ncbi:uncharacterized protein A1O9_00845 [Exophiala aquamarina CBS 119918]|uniref:Uncharacterized protein n=1 Tax=Exophiala aquamarina CBS 119918 TaxID=1182545 RepID=A0A072PT11_9EURO|nr:uncharacterized protein A1O9_00845 [Exophiala aquamarina CBS 119918]KEF62872.1 hypothetical protein A1O9_00845 [Exophiala aquamarina CBS 119918]
MARIAQFFSYLHSILISVPQHGYHNISRVVQPQIRSISESFTVRVGKDPSKSGIELQNLKPRDTTNGTWRVENSKRQRR